MRARKICSHPECFNLQPCPDHARKPWEGSTRRDKVKLSGSAEQKRARYILQKHDTICHVCENPGADQVDHVEPLAEGGADHEDNLKPIHSEPCHREKTADEARRAIRGGR